MEPDAGGIQHALRYRVVLSKLQERRYAARGLYPRPKGRGFTPHLITEQGGKEMDNIVEIRPEQREYYDLLARAIMEIYRRTKDVEPAPPAEDAADAAD
jgi:hypothetical protein